MTPTCGLSPIPPHATPPNMTARARLPIVAHWEVLMALYLLLIRRKWTMKGSVPVGSPRIGFIRFCRVPHPCAFCKGGDFRFIDSIFTYKSTCFRNTVFPVACARVAAILHQGRIRASMAVAQQPIGFSKLVQ